jgi:hypothetical protein
MVSDLVDEGRSYLETDPAGVCEFTAGFLPVSVCLLFLLVSAVSAEKPPQIEPPDAVFPTSNPIQPGVSHIPLTSHSKIRTI